MSAANWRRTQLNWRSSKSDHFPITFLSASMRAQSSVRPFRSKDTKRWCSPFRVPPEMSAKCPRRCTRSKWHTAEVVSEWSATVGTMIRKTSRIRRKQLQAIEGIVDCHRWSFYSLVLSLTEDFFLSHFTFSLTCLELFDLKPDFECHWKWPIATSVKCKRYKTLQSLNVDQNQPTLCHVKRRSC